MGNVRLTNPWRKKKMKTAKLLTILVLVAAIVLIGFSGAEAAKAKVVTAKEATAAHAQAQESRELKLSVLEDKIRGGLAGQMVGVSYGEPTEFRAQGEIYDKEIRWKQTYVRRSINQDDLYVEMTFAEVMDRVGLDATTEQYGEAFRDSEYGLWHANAGARRNLNNGIKAPMSGHPKYNMHSNDIDFQIEADFIGLMTPGMPQRTIELCDRVGHVMNYGDGVYGGMFVCGMYSEAYFETDVRKVVEAGVACMPEGSGYRAIIEDVIATHEKYPDDWKECWRIINEKWDKHDSCPDGALAPFNIDARLNGAYIAIGMLYGDGDFAKTLELSTRCGQDSDCNPASAGGVLGVMYGYEALDEKWVGGIADIEDRKFRFTEYSLNDFVASTQKRVLQAVLLSGGEVKEDRIVIGRQKPVPPKLEQWSMGIPVKRIACDDNAWTWTGQWEERKGGRSGRSIIAMSNKGGNEAALEFTGSAIAVMGQLSNAGGMANVYIDGAKAGEINSYIIPNTFDRNLWHTYGLEDGPHTLRIVTLDKADARSKGKRVAILRAIVFRPE